MIINGASRANGAQLAEYLTRDSETTGLNAYLLRKGPNEHVKLIEIRGIAADTLGQALYEMQEIADGGQHDALGLYHANINPETAYELTDEQYLRCVDVLEDELGLTSQPRAVVAHRKKGRTHLHVVWQRTDVATLKIIRDSFDYAAHERAARRLERELGHHHIQGVHIHGDGRPVDRTPPAERHNAACLAAWQGADSPAAFVHALAAKGYVLTRGDKRPYVVLAPDGDAFALNRALPDVTTRDLKQRLRDIARPSLKEAMKMAEQQKAAAAEREPPQPAPEPSLPGTARAKAAVSNNPADLAYPAHWGFERYEPMGQEQLRIQDRVRQAFRTQPRATAQGLAARARRWAADMIRAGHLPTRGMIIEKRQRDRMMREPLPDHFNDRARNPVDPAQVAAQAAERARRRRQEAERAALASVREDGARRFQALDRTQQARRVGVMGQHRDAEHWRAASQANLLSRQEQEGRALAARHAAEQRRGLSWLIGALTGANARTAERHATERRDLLLGQHEQRQQLQQKSGEERYAETQQLRALDHAEVQERTLLVTELSHVLARAGWEGHDQARGVEQIRMFAETAVLAPAYAPSHAQAQIAWHAPSLSH